MLRAVTVDFWGTLILEGPRADERYRERRLADFEAILARAGLAVPVRALARGYEQSARELAWIWSESRDVPVARHVASLLEGADAGLSARVSPDVLDALVEAYARPALLVPPEAAPGAREALLALRSRGLRLAIVSNTMRTPGTSLRKILDMHGLLGLFEVLTFSDEVGVRKPAPEIFRLTLERLGVPAAGAVHVGDDPGLDVTGARAAGLRVVQVVHPGRDGLRLEPHPERGPDAVVERLADLEAALLALGDAP